MKLPLCTFGSLLFSRGIRTHFSPNLVRQCQNRNFSTQNSSPEVPSPDLNWNFITDPANFDKISKNISLRKSSASLQEVTNLHKNFASKDKNTDVYKSLLTAGLKLPNMCADRVLEMGEENCVVFQKPFHNPDYKLRKFEDIARILSGARVSNLGLLTGERTYYLTGVIAELEQALIHWTVDQLTKSGFSLISVPDLLHPDIIRACGMNVDGERTQVYQLDPVHGQVALSGTAEMALGGYFCGKVLPRSELPGKMCAVSRCYRAETGGQQDEKGLYRVHQFTKVEMFCVTSGEYEGSKAALEMIHNIEREMFNQLGLVFRVLDMCGEELGDPACEKYDVEAWMPGREMWGEISSCSNCTDYQARRLGIKDEDGNYCHTVNGTACAIPRMLISICEQNQLENGSVKIPEVLQPYMRNRELMEPKPRKERLNFIYINSANYFEKNKKL